MSIQKLTSNELSSFKTKVFPDRIKQMGVDKLQAWKDSGCDPAMISKLQKTFSQDLYDIVSSYLLQGKPIYIYDAWIDTLFGWLNDKTLTAPSKERVRLSIMRVEAIRAKALEKCDTLVWIDTQKRTVNVSELAKAIYWMYYSDATSNQPQKPKQATLALFYVKRLNVTRSEKGATTENAQPIEKTLSQLISQAVNDEVNRRGDISAVKASEAYEAIDAMEKYVTGR